MIRPRTAALLSAVALSAAVLPALPAAAGATAAAITFDDGFTPGDRCGFIDVNPLRGKYADLGVHFRGPTSDTGGAILDQCGGFGVDARSGTLFLAFNSDSQMANGGVPRGPETIVFDSKQTMARIYVSQGDAMPDATFKLVAKRRGHTVRVATLSTSTNTYQALRVAAPHGFTKVLLKANDPDGAWVADDLDFHD